MSASRRATIPSRGANPKVDDRATSPEVFNPLHERFSFTLDACAQQHNAKLPRYFTPEQDGLVQSWAGERVFCNPPYSSIEPWVLWASTQMQATPPADLIVMLLPANRTEQGWWHRNVEPYRDGRHELGPRTEFLPGRLRFIAHDATEIKPNERPPFGCVLLIWGS